MSVVTPSASALPSGFKEAGPAWPPHNDSDSLLRREIVVASVQATGVEPDELFTQFTVAEVKQKKRQLQAEADTKREDLRWMVGERYRELLQASTSIISMAHSADTVASALARMKTTVTENQEDQRYNMYLSSSTKEDTHLHALQSLSSHLKLLLDSPEHLWRLLEQRRHLQAAWLFLLNRVVYRALLREEGEDEERWDRYDIDVMEQFPLVRSQWEAVAQFRAQLVQKATLHLRDHALLPEDVCATILSLYLLNSHTLPEALALFFAQRSKALSSAKSRRSDRKAAQRKGLSSTQRARVLIRDVSSQLRTILDVIFKTVGTTRDVFCKKHPKQLSMMQAALSHIQTAETMPSNTMPLSLQISTKSLLSSLPSSSQLLQLPSSIIFYRPYVNPESPSSILSEAELNVQTESWLQSASGNFLEVLASRLGEVRTIQGLWKIRARLREPISTASALEEAEIKQLLDIVDEQCRKRISVICSETLQSMGQEFQENLSKILNLISAESLQIASNFELLPAEFLLCAPALPNYHGSSTSTAFLQYKDELERQALGRTPHVHSLLGSLEKQALALKDDLGSLSSFDQPTQEVIRNLLASYVVAAQDLCLSILQSLAKATESISGDGNFLASVSSIARLADAVCTSSPFLSHLNLKPAVDKEIRKQMQALYTSAVKLWRDRSVGDFVINVSIHYRDNRPIPSSDDDLVRMLHPSPSLIETLATVLRATEAIHFSVSNSPTLVTDTFQDFAIKFLDASSTDGSSRDRTFGDLQSVVDTLFLAKIVETWQDRWPNLQISFQNRRTAALRRHRCSEKVISGLEGNASDCLLRTQTMFTPLLSLVTLWLASKGKGDRALLVLGPPTTQEQKSPSFPLDIAQSMPRLGMLLAGGATNT